MPTNINKNTSPILIRILDTTGDGTGTKDAIGNYSGSVTRFLIKPGVGEKFIISRMLGQIVDSGSFDSGSYGNGITLTNGITAGYRKNGVEIDLLDGQVVKTNVDWAGVCYDVTHSNFGAGNEYLNFRWTFSKSGTWIELNGNNGDELWVGLHDNFTGLISQFFTVQGYK